MSITSEMYDIIRKPVVTEKSTNSSEYGAVVFEVDINSNKNRLNQLLKPYLRLKLKQ